jgi:D-amino peptidase
MSGDVLIIADIEGSSNCWDYDGSSFMTDGWARACLGMTVDVAAVAAALAGAGVPRVAVKDFHRTGYNIFPEMVPWPVKILSGYAAGPVPGIGDPGSAEAVMFIGMHAASGSGGFLAHTLTSRIERLEVNGRLMSEVELFASSLAPYNIRPVFFSGCPVACGQARAAVPGIETFGIDKSGGPNSLDAAAWRKELANAEIRSLGNTATVPYRPEGPFDAVVTMRDGEGPARKLARRRGLQSRGADIILHAGDIHELYTALVRLCYLTPLVEKVAPAALRLYGLAGRYGLRWARKRLKRGGLLA